MRLAALGHDSVHTLDLPDGNQTTDDEISRITADEDRIVASKDRDFLDSHVLTGSPPRLLWVTVGNITNDNLLTLFEARLSDLEAAFQQADCVELTTTALIIHQRRSP